MSVAEETTACPAGWVPDRLLRRDQALKAHRRTPYPSGITIANPPNSPTSGRDVPVSGKATKGWCTTARITTIGELTASIAHEVNQPLAAVVANADACVAWLARQEPDLAEARAAAERTIQGATRASEVIVRIRSLINKTAPEKSPVQLNRLIEETAALAGGQASRNNVSLELELSPGVPAVQGDSIQLQQVILNLLMNGIEAMTNVADRPRRLVVGTRLVDANQVRVSVEDSGIGLSSGVMARLFEPFFTTRSKGIGMGLSISRSIIEAHGGRLWAELPDACGSIFRFTLPGGDGKVA
jgi:C4-dicarboxylate-specific signal transduction histidine kinase